eukprot:Partr_v1_DN26218_c0_g1_i1_m48197
MLKSSDSRLPCLWGLDGSFWLQSRLFISDIRLLQNSDSSLAGDDAAFQCAIYFYNSHPIRTVLVVGVVVGVTMRASHMVLMIDDCTATIEVSLFFASSEPSMSRKLKQFAGMSPASAKAELMGKLISVVGRISEFRNERQLTAFSYSVEVDPNAETVHFLRCLEFKRYLDKPLAAIPDSIKENVKALESVMNLGAPVSLPSQVEGESAVDLSLLTAAPSEVTLKYRIQDKILKNYPHFTFSQLLCIEDLVQHARLALDIGPILHDEASDLRVRAAVSRCLFHLVKEGVIYLDDIDADIYARVSVADNIAPAILEFIKSRRSHVDDEPAASDIPLHLLNLLAQLPRRKDLVVEAPAVKSRRDAVNPGTSERDIVKHLKSSIRFRFVPRAVITAAIDHLIDNCLIFEVGFREFAPA